MVVLEAELDISHGCPGNHRHGEQDAVGKYRQVQGIGGENAFQTDSQDGSRHHGDHVRGESGGGDERDGPEAP